MSRIHEALKKAAQERSTQVPDPSVSGLVDFSAESVTAALAPNAEQLGVQRAFAERSEAKSLQFEEFVKQCSRPVWKTEFATSVFSTKIEDQIGAEKFRTLRSRLYQVAATQKLRKILITSSLPAEGKTFVAANLAQSIVRQPDRRVLLIDGDLRASRLHLILGAPNKIGLTDYLRGDAPASEVIQVGPQGNLCLIPRGKEVSNPSELLHSERMKHLLDTVSHMFDWVILDSPPSLAVHDASILSDMCDGVLFVVRAGSTDFEIAEKASAEFREKNLLGVVLNRAEEDDGYGGYYYGYSPLRDGAEPA
ncbi:MAG: hypothetical protein PVS2B2_10150 [Candidatus Acidiferrum sp.]